MRNERLRGAGFFQEFPLDRLDGQGYKEGSDANYNGVIATLLLARLTSCARERHS